MTSARLLQWLMAASIAATAVAVSAGEHRMATPLLPAYQRECASCHVAYPPGLLPAPSWARIMSNLPRHFGTDASLEPAQVTEISGWLARNASARAEAPPEDRITRGAWFVRKHREVPASAWSRPSVKNASNCAACHAGADRGEFNEHDVRIPR